MEGSTRLPDEDRKFMEFVSREIEIMAGRQRQRVTEN